MIVRFLSWVVAILFASPVLADNKFFGVWQGEAVEQGSEAPYALTLSIFEVNGRIFQHSVYGPPLNCAGGGVVMNSGAGTLQLSEVIIRNRSNCADGTIRVYLNGEDRLIWEWFYPDGKYAARADLFEQGGEP